MPFSGAAEAISAYYASCDPLTRVFKLSSEESSQYDGSFSASSRLYSGGSLWGKKTLCFLGFYEWKYEAMKSLVCHMMEDVLKNGGGVILQTELSQQGALPLRKIDFFVCNYSDGYEEARFLNVMEGKCATPLWMLACHRDGYVYSPLYHPLFLPNSMFNCGRCEPWTKLNLLLIGAEQKKLRLKGKSGRGSKVMCLNDEDLIWRFLSLSGSSRVWDLSGREPSHVIIADYPPPTIAPTPLSKGGFREHGTRWAQERPLNSHYINLLKQAQARNIPIVGLDWLFESYKKQGAPLDVSRFLLHSSPSGLQMNQAFPRSDGGSRQDPPKSCESPSDSSSLIMEGSIILFVSYIAAAKHPKILTKLKGMGAELEKNLFVTNPITVLAPWAVEDGGGIVGATEDEEEEKNERLPTHTYLKRKRESANLEASLKNLGSAVLIVCADDLKAGIFDKLRYLILKYCEESGVENHGFLYPSARAWRLNQLPVVNENWVELCWKKKLLVPVSVENGGVEIPKILQDGNYLDLMDDFDDAHLTLHKRRRRSVITLNDLADSITYGDGKSSAYKLEKKKLQDQSRAQLVQKYTVMQDKARETWKSILSEQY